MIKKWLDERKQEKSKVQQYASTEEQDREEIYELAEKLGIDCWNETTLYLTLFRLLNEQERKIRKLEEEK